MWDPQWRKHRWLRGPATASSWWRARTNLRWASDRGAECQAGDLVLAGAGCGQIERPQHVREPLLPLGREAGRHRSAQPGQALTDKGEETRRGVEPRAPKT